MKNNNYLKGIFVLLITVALFSCKNDNDKIDQSLDLIGTWQRSDVTDQFEYTLSFQSNENGSRIVREINNKGQGISSSRSFNWTINDLILTIDYGGDVDVTSFDFDANGYLFLNDLTALHFVKIEE